MSDALWNGIIGAGGAAICCGVYFGVKAIVNLTKRIKVNKVRNENIKELENYIDNKAMNTEKSITIKIPSKKQIFTRKNIRSFMLLILSAYCIYWATDILDYFRGANFEWMTFEGDYYAYSAQLQRTELNTITNLGNTFCMAMFYLFWFLGILCFILGITGFSFKKSGNIEGN